MTTAIIDYQSGNLRSAEKSFERAAREAGLDERIVVTADPDAVRRADRIVLPGVGAFADCRAGLLLAPGLFEAIEEGVRKGGKPFFGICVGMQLLASVGLEYGETPGFDWIPGRVARIHPDDPSLKVPHMGWNALSLERAHPVFRDVREGDHAYFVHSYHLEPAREADRIATVGYGQVLTAAVARDTIIGTQFHPEKSQKVGLAIIRDFLTWAP